MTKSRFTLSEMRRIKQNDLDNTRQRIATSKNRSRSHYIPEKPEPDKIKIIAEIKRSSPSKGLIKEISPMEQAKKYIQAGAAGLSVLTESQYFSGSPDDLKQVADNSILPVLCKDFIYFKEQIELAYLYGADMVLLIAACLSENELTELYKYTKDIGITPLPEVHSKDELGVVLSLSPEYLLVNMRNLKTLDIDRSTGIETLNNIPDNIIKISASSIHTGDDIKYIYEKTGAGIFLVGTALMQADDPVKFLQELSSVH